MSTLGRIFTLDELSAYEAGREDAARDIERILNREMQDHLYGAGIPRSQWTINYENAIRQARGLQA